MQELQPLSQEADTIETALSKLKTLDQNGLYVVDRNRVPVGYATMQALSSAAAAGRRELKAVSIEEFPQTDESTHLVELYGTSIEEIPIAVVDDAGHYQGVLHSDDILHALAAGTHGVEPNGAASPPAQPTRAKTPVKTAVEA
jgi:predicted transcriptional regulator